MESVDRAQCLVLLPGHYFPLAVSVAFLSCLLRIIADETNSLFIDIRMCGEFTGKSSVHTAGGAFGIITAFIAFYIALAGLLTKDTSYFSLPVGELSRASTPKTAN